MAARTFRNLIVKALFGPDIKALKEEHNALVEEVEELKAHYKVHTHSATGTKAPDGNAGTGFTPAFAKPDAKKFNP